MHPAYRENTGLVMLEALACGLPALVTASCGYVFHIAAANAGLVAPDPFDQTAFNQQFQQMMTSPSRDVWSRNGCIYAEQLMQANDGYVEAEVLLAVAQRAAI